MRRPESRLPKAKAPRALFTIRDGETLLVAVQAVRTAAQVKEARPEAGKRCLVLDLTLGSSTGDGMDFQTGEQIELLDGEDRPSVDEEAPPLLPRPLLENRIIPPNNSAPFQVV